MSFHFDRPVPVLEMFHVEHSPLPTAEFASCRAYPERTESDVPDQRCILYRSNDPNGLFSHIKAAQDPEPHAHVPVVVQPHDQMVGFRTSYHRDFPDIVLFLGRIELLIGKISFNQKKESVGRELRVDHDALDDFRELIDVPEAEPFSGTDARAVDAHVTEDDVLELGATEVVLKSPFTGGEPRLTGR